MQGSKSVFTSEFGAFRAAVGTAAGLVDDPSLAWDAVVRIKAAKSGLRVRTTDHDSRIVCEVPAEQVGEPLWLGCRQLVEALAMLAEELGDAADNALVTIAEGDPYATVAAGGRTLKVRRSSPRAVRSAVGTTEVARPWRGELKGALAHALSVNPDWVLVEVGGGVVRLVGHGESARAAGAVEDRGPWGATTRARGVVDADSLEAIVNGLRGPDVRIGWRQLEEGGVLSFKGDRLRATLEARAAVPRMFDVFAEAAQCAIVGVNASELRAAARRAAGAASLVSRRRPLVELKSQDGRFGVGSAHELSEDVAWFACTSLGELPGWPVFEPEVLDRALAPFEGLLVSLHVPPTGGGILVGEASRSITRVSPVTLVQVWEEPPF